MRGGTFNSQLRGWRPGESAPRTFNSYPRGNAPCLNKSDGSPRIRSGVHGPRFPPNPNYYPRTSGSDNSHSPHGVEMRFEESIEITSDRPFLPQKRASPASSVPNNTPNWNLRGDNPEAQADLNAQSQSVPSSNAPNDSNGQETSEGFSGKALLTAKRRKHGRRPKKSEADVHSARSDIFCSETLFEEASHPSTRGPFAPCSKLTGQKPGSPVDNYEEAAEACRNLWKELECAIQLRECAAKDREQKFVQRKVHIEALEEDYKQAAAMRNEVMEERRRLEEEAQRIREEKDAMERASTDIAVQMAELKQIQRQVEKEKAALAALKLELDSREIRLQERECVTSGVETAGGAAKTELKTPSTNGYTNCRQTATFSAELGVVQGNRRNRADKGASLKSLLGGDKIAIGDPPPSKISPASNKGLALVKAEPVTRVCDSAHKDQSRRNCEFSDNETATEDMPLAARLKSQGVGPTQRRSVEELKQLEDLGLESSRRTGDSRRKEPQLVGGKPLSYDIHVKKNKVSIEVALQEDAPGLLEQLEERGLLEDMHVYEDLGPDDSLAMENPASEFVQLESVIGKLWGSTTGLGKDLVPAKGQGSGNVPRYCLACLLSLIEQTKSLRRRKWPVEWGWCRSLRSFLFVFERHNRIVLERPEYGFATYFFELVQTVPVSWQVQRLVTVMSVATTGRAALLENRPLTVGLDLTNEEAAILEDYGWNRSSGVGSLLNFCHRVVHDYNKGQDIADLGNDWKQKIGKLLMDGYDQGSIVQSVPKKLQKVLEVKLNNPE